MPRDTIRAPLCTLLSGLLMVACGNTPETVSALVEEPLGTQEAALCSGLSVTTLTISGASSYASELAASGSWAVSTSANAARLEYYVDGYLSSADERIGTAGSWYVSKTGMACGSHTFEVKAYPMVVDSSGNRTICYTSPRIVSQTVVEDCSVCGSTSVKIASTTNYGAGNYAYLKCPAGWKTLGGGCSDDFTSTALMSTHPWGDDGWTCEFKNQPGSLTAYAMCGCRNTLSVQNTVSVGNVVTATCPSGKIVVGGGCSDHYTSTTLQSSIPNGNTGWTCRFQTNPGSLAATAYCVDPSASPGLQTVTSTTTTSNVVAVTCPSGKKVIGGGCRDDRGATALQTSMPWSTNTWSCGFRAVTGSLTAYALCE
ncbi:hypothetical protein [Archangium sp.]|uniref:hypothetical protein n=1 Tax=Archangium sp. TaxID=1872627 RepID=UPI002D48EB76|nr:hypothetical protein [Archangium sp.]HYO51659.1 hypothetical protein [Archangium sp.]